MQDDSRLGQGKFGSERPEEEDQMPAEPPLALAEESDVREEQEDELAIETES